MNQFKPQTLCEEYLASMQCECRTSNFNPFRWNSPAKWTKREKIDKAKQIALELGFKVIDCNCSLLIYPKTLPETAKEEGYVTLISSHADTVPEIETPFVNSKIANKGTPSETRYLKGTFDNSITNAVLLSLLHADLPKNTAFVLTGDEETGRCSGAKQAINSLERIIDDDVLITAFAMDVTWEGAPDSILTFENLKKTDEELSGIILQMINEGYPLTCVATDGFPSSIPKQCRSKRRAMFDEGAAYRQMDSVSMACSICIPTSGPMHSDAGMIIEAEKLEQYRNAVKSFVWKLRKGILKDEVLVKTPSPIR